MPPAAVKTKAEKSKWERAKRLAIKEGHAKDYAYIMSIFQSLKGKKK